MKTNGEVITATMVSAWSCLVWAGAGLVVYIVHGTHQQAWERAENVLQQQAMGGQHIAWIVFVMAIAFALHQIGRAVGNAITAVIRS